MQSFVRSFAALCADAPSLPYDTVIVPMRRVKPVDDERATVHRFVVAARFPQLAVDVEGITAPFTLKLPLDDDEVHVVRHFIYNAELPLPMLVRNTKRLTHVAEK